MFALPNIDGYSHDQVDTRAELHSSISLDRKLKLAGLGRQCVLVKVAAQEHRYCFDRKKLENFSINHLKVSYHDELKPEIVMFKRCFCTHSL